MSDFLPVDLLALQHFHFLRPYWLLALIPFFIIFKSFSRRDDNLFTWREVMSADILAQLTVKGDGRNWFSPNNLMTIVMLTATIVLAGPSWRQQASPFSEDKSALIIALDVSETMNQSDLQPTRLLRAKQKIIELLALRGDANTALIAYSGTAHTVMPITGDSDMIRHFLDSLDSSLMPRSGKLPQSVLPIADELLKQTRVPGTILIVGDGATSDTVQLFSEFFRGQSHQLIVWAIGNVALAEGAVSKSSSIIPMQLSQLSNLAQSSQGRLVLLTHDKQDVSQVNRFIENNLAIVDDASRPWHDAGYPLVLIIALVFLLWFRRGWTLQW